MIILRPLPPIQFIFSVGFGQMQVLPLEYSYYANVYTASASTVLSMKPTEINGSHDFG